jgi:hypothetical protein
MLPERPAEGTKDINRNKDQQLHVMGKSRRQTAGGGDCVPSSVATSLTSRDPGKSRPELKAMPRARAR